MDYIYPQGGSNATIYEWLYQDNSGSNPGEPATDLTSASTGMGMAYVRPLSTVTTVTLSDLTAVDSAHSDGGMFEVDATNMPGLYRFDLPDAVLARGESFARVTIKADAIVPRTVEIVLDAGASVVQGNVNDASATATSFVTDLAGGADDIYNGMFLLLPDRPEVSKVTDWVDSSKTITVEQLSSAPADTDPIVLIHNP